MRVKGLCSWFGGPDDFGMAEDEPLAFIYEVSDKPVLFLPGSTEALGRNLDPSKFYIACRWDYDETPREMLLTHLARVTATATGKSMYAWPADWGPAGPESDHDTGRVADISPGLMDYLGIETDDEVTVEFPFPVTRRKPEMICISAGHGSHVAGAEGFLNEVECAREICLLVQEALEVRHKITAPVFFDNVSTSQNENLNRIVNWHNDENPPHDLDVSIHLNAGGGSGPEVCYITQGELAAEVSAAIAAASGLPDRGKRSRPELFFLANTRAPAILVELLFVDHQADAAAYHEYTNAMADAIAAALAGESAEAIAQADKELPEVVITIKAPKHVKITLRQEDSEGEE